MATFRHDDLWDRITALTKSSTRSQVAVAYLNTGASKLLPLRENDVLVVDMSDRAMKAGNTNPDEVLAYLDRDVQVFSVENLHAKVFAFDDRVIVGSSNVSYHSRNDLVEAAIETADPKLRATVVAWIDSIAVDPITPELAKAKKKLYQPPRWGGGGGAKNGKKPKAPRGRQLWLLWTVADDFEDEKLETQAKDAKQLLKSTSYEVDPLRCRQAERFARSCRDGDTVVCIHHVGRQVQVWPPARILKRVRYLASGVKRMGVHLERRKDDEGRPWREFKAAANKLGVKAGKTSIRVVRDRAVHLPLLRFFRA
jgi:hypothetical protein